MKKKEGPRFERATKTERMFLELSGSIIESQVSIPEQRRELIDLIHKKRKDKYVVKLNLINATLRKMQKFGYIEWLENALKKRMTDETGSSRVARQGPNTPAPGQVKTYSVLSDEKGRPFVRIPATPLTLTVKEKVEAEFFPGKIILTPKREKA